MTYISVSQELFEQAEANEIFRTEVGSTLHGTGLPGHEDLDLMGITIMPTFDVLGMDPFEQVIWRTADGPSVRSTPDDTDLTIYSLKKYLRLAAAGNPSILVPLWAPRNKWVKGQDHPFLSNRGVALAALMANKHLFVSKNAGRKFLGYAESQRQRMVDSHDGVRSPRTNRPELIEQFGYDTKFAMHMLRLCIQGTELMTSGGITLPVPTALGGDFLRTVRSGEMSYGEILQWSTTWINALKAAIDRADHLPDKADLYSVSMLSKRMHLDFWTSNHN